MNDYSRVLLVFKAVEVYLEFTIKSKYRDAYFIVLSLFNQILLNHFTKKNI